MGEKCIEVCAPAKDLSWFKLKEVDIEDYPPISLEEVNRMPPRARGILYAVYLKKVVDTLQGVENVERQITFDKRRSRVIDAIKSTGLFDGAETRDPIRPHINQENSNP
jgi:hypothetical protein